MNHFQTAVFHAARDPNRIAISDSTKLLSRLDFVHHVLRVAASLQAMGIGRGDRVCAVMHNSIDFVALYYATAVTGFILVPVNTRYDHGDFCHVFEDSDPKLVLYAPEFEDRISGYRQGADEGTQWVGLTDTLFDAMPDFDTQTARVGAVDDDEVSLILYTSGTTSRPKGAMLTHRNLAANAMNYQVELGITENSSSILATPLFHIGGFGVLNGPVLFAGGTLHVVGRYDPETLLDALKATEPSHLFLLSTMWVGLTDRPEFADLRFNDVNYVQTAASPLSEWRQDRIRKVFPNAEFGWGYGMTESCVTSIKNRTTQEIQDHPGSIGYVWRHVAARLVDAAGQVLPGTNQVGELQVRGPTVFAGYWNNPQATEDVFTPDGWLKTGDLLEFDADGFAYFRGRAKDMIKTGGENVAAIEVEQCLTEHPQVSDAAIMGLPHEYWGEELVAVVVPVPGTQPGGDELQQHCRARLSAFKVPKRIFIHETVPKSSSGKVQKFILKRKLMEQEARASDG
ncbi:AMP-binding protein [Rhodobacteraceae bacterium F11138]|nr:AMP-binding protein [Rhodobacteraceae bacterium F11138]